ncbi:hypothetical protein FOPG_19549 [Fusarium oxysporum f. sp. conglutinans race 2 54008]|uniref:Uncharacterized protein n=1 Tax=Fusarium oxysporum f. sp. conglutinans race 2 54008 TaxID=1089457 RepID=X0GWH6_FUSOX|nr:hypothetical protein FOPG_19549 [Fusarium oxysporum f. sp. conglutinans race 2 54008]
MGRASQVVPRQSRLLPTMLPDSTLESTTPNRSSTTAVLLDIVSSTI